MDRNGVTAQMFSQAHSSFAQDARAAIGSARIGELKAIHVECIFAIGPPGTAKSLAPRIERARPDRFTFVDAKREMFDIGVYAVALVRWLTGRKISTVDAVTSNFFFQEHEQAGVEDFGIMIMDLEGGVSATIAAGRFGWTSHPARGGHFGLCLSAQMAHSPSTRTIQSSNFTPTKRLSPCPSVTRLTQWACGRRRNGNQTS